MQTKQLGSSRGEDRLYSRKEGRLDTESRDKNFRECMQTSSHYQADPIDRKGNIVRVRWSMNMFQEQNHMQKYNKMVFEVQFYG